MRYSTPSIITMVPSCWAINPLVSSGYICSRQKLFFENPLQGIKLVFLARNCSVMNVKGLIITLSTSVCKFSYQDPSYKKNETHEISKIAVKFGKRFLATKFLSGMVLNQWSTFMNVYICSILSRIHHSPHSCSMVDLINWKSHTWPLGAATYVAGYVCSR